jgi:hypothetical protein
LTFYPPPSFKPVDSSRISGKLHPSPQMAHEDPHLLLFVIYN